MFVLGDIRQFMEIALERQGLLLRRFRLAGSGAARQVGVVQGILQGAPVEIEIEVEVAED
ncbi:hypothetical protein Z046_09265 [Pseudomonas aeruginosa VRFPA09]|nr:hypothetical protein Z046_09265 [Pseudomonas aeruginosa VRFPA09]